MQFLPLTLPCIVAWVIGSAAARSGKLRIKMRIFSTEAGEEKRAFNTQACEQLNSWLGGFEFILKCITIGNFNWFLHTMLFYHTKYVIEKQKRKQAKAQKKNIDDSDGDDDDDDNLNP